MDGGGRAEPRGSVAGTSSVNVRAGAGGYANIAGAREFEGLADAYRSPAEHGRDQLGQAARTGGNSCLSGAGPRRPGTSLDPLTGAIIFHSDRKGLIRPAERGNAQ